MTLELISLIATNLVAIGIAYGMLRAEQRALKETLVSAMKEFNDRLTELKRDFSERNAELRSDVLRSRERVHELTDQLMKIMHDKG